METEGNLLQKMKNVFSDNEDKEKIAEEIKRLDAIPTSSLKKYWKAMKKVF